jgi:hypothetical protein
MNRENERYRQTLYMSVGAMERLKTKAEESTHLACTGLLGELEHPNIKTRLIDEIFASVFERLFIMNR